MSEIGTWPGMAPCPWCGERQPWYHYDNDSAWIACEHCKAMGPAVLIDENPEFWDQNHDVCDEAMRRWDDLPRWMDMPSVAGWWFVRDKMAVRYVSEFDVVAGFILGRVYGPIPEDKDTGGG